MITHPVLFLDFDGVLNSLTWATIRHVENPECMFNELDRTCVERVNRIIAATGAKVVVSSSWRKGRTVEWLREFLESQGFVGEVIGKTPTTLSHRERGHEIQHWMTEHQCLASRIIILDDDSDMVHLLPRHVKTTWKHGLQDEHVDAAIAILKETPHAEEAV